MLALYLTWSPVGAALIIGEQGRYFLPLLPLLGRAVPILPGQLSSAALIAGMNAMYPRSPGGA